MKLNLSFYATLCGLFVILESIAWNGHVRLSYWEWLMVGMAASLGGRAIAYMTIGLPIRMWVVKTTTHPTFGAYTEPKYANGWRNALGELLSCPLCSGTWIVAAILLLWNYFPNQAYMTAQVLSIASFAAFMTRTHEYLESAKDSAWENAGLSRLRTMALKPHKSANPTLELHRIQLESESNNE